MTFLEKSLNLDQSELQMIEDIIFQANIEDEYIQALQDEPNLGSVNLVEKAHDVLLEQVSTFSKNAGMTDFYKFLSESVFVNGRKGYKVYDTDVFVDLVTKYSPILQTSPEYVKFMIRRLS